MFNRGFNFQPRKNLITVFFAALIILFVMVLKVLPFSRAPGKPLSKLYRLSFTSNLKRRAKLNTNKIASRKT